MEELIHRIQAGLAYMPELEDWIEQLKGEHDADTVFLAYHAAKIANEF